VSDTLIGVLLGGTIGLGSTFLLEIFKNRSRSKSLANAFKGEITALITITRKRNYLGGLREAINYMRENPDEVFLIKISASTDFLQVYQSNCSQIGLLKGVLPEKIAEFYVNVLATLQDFETMSSHSLESVTNSELTDLYVELSELLNGTVKLGEEIAQEVERSYS